METEQERQQRQSDLAQKKSDDAAAADKAVDAMVKRSIEEHGA